MLSVWWVFSKWLRVWQSRALRVIFVLKRELLTEQVCKYVVIMLFILLQKLIILIIIIIIKYKD